jgi:GT2 family glycosyltransferase
MRVTIVIPTYNKVDLTSPCLEALVANTPEDLYEVVIVDNASSDGTRKLLESLGGDVRIVLNETNEGFGPACNKGASMANGEFVCFLNNDTLVRPGWLEAMVSAMDQDSCLAAVQPLLLFPDGRVNSAGDLVFGDQAWNYAKGYPDSNHPALQQRRAPDYASGACLLVRKAMFDAVGGFDDYYAPAYYEDTDLSFSFRAKGWKVLYEPRAVVVHVEGGTSESALTSDFKERQMTKNREYFWNKWAKELEGRPYASPEIVDQWAFRDQGEFNPLPYDAPPQ